MTELGNSHRGIRLGRWLIPVVILGGLGAWQTLTHGQDKTLGYNELTPEEKYVIEQKGTERAWSGKYVEHKADGTYLCKKCDAPLYQSTDKFDSHCGWPSFDDAIPGAVGRTTDADGMRTEITCANCGGHLGHVFEGEGLTDKNVRHCVNSLSLGFEPVVADVATKTTETAYFAGGCFWGVEHLLQNHDGVISVRSGYMGGHVDHPTYKQVCYTNTGHAETVEVVYDPAVTDFETVTKLFFEIHDPTQVDRQGPDRGSQYRSAVFYVDDSQREVTEKLIGILKGKGLDVVTAVAKADTFWPAEDYHQDYYAENGKTPYCHFYTKRF
jgi:peptide methionine sulfoxide reductase msrA/msrB